MSNFFVTLAVFLITVIGALFAIPYFIDWNGYRGVFEEEATRLLGREVRVGGAVNLHLLPTPYFRFEKVRIADTSVNLQEPFFRADSLTIKLSDAADLPGRVEANEIELQRPVLRLALNDKATAGTGRASARLCGNAAYLPTNVALTSVKITDGVLALHGADGAERTRFEGLNGELSAPALDGPYRFRGTFGKARAERELQRRHGAARARRLRALQGRRCGSATARSTYTLDGRLADLMGKPRIDGELTRAAADRRPLAAPRAAARGAAASAGGRTASRPSTDTERAGVRPQGQRRCRPGRRDPLRPRAGVRAGWAAAARHRRREGPWRDALAVEMSLSSRWLDLDRIAGAGRGDRSARQPHSARHAPCATCCRREGRSRATFAIDQANVGREAVSNLRLSLARSQDKLEIEELRLGMPGGSRGELQGVVSGPPEAPIFDGSVSLRGSEPRALPRLGDGQCADVRRQGRRHVRRPLAALDRAGHASPRNVIGDLSGTTIRGDAHYRWEGRPELSLLRREPAARRARLRPGGSQPRRHLRCRPARSAARQARGPTGGRRRPASPAGAAPRPTPSSASTPGSSSPRRAPTATSMMEIELKGGHLRVPLLRVASDDGFSLELEGEVENAATRPKGTLRAVIGAEFGAGDRASGGVARHSRQPSARTPRRAQAMVPLRLAGSMSLGARTPTSADLVLDGEVNGGSRQAQRPARWRRRPAGARAPPM